MKEFDLRKNNGGAGRGQGRKAEFANPITLTMTTERDLLTSLRKKFGKKLNGKINEFLKELEKTTSF